MLNMYKYVYISIPNAYVLNYHSLFTVQITFLVLASMIPSREAIGDLHTNLANQFAVSDLELCVILLVYFYAAMLVCV